MARGKKSKGAMKTAMARHKQWKKAKRAAKRADGPEQKFITAVEETLQSGHGEEAGTAPTTAKGDMSAANTNPKGLQRTNFPLPFELKNVIYGMLLSHEYV